MTNGEFKSMKSTSFRYWGKMLGKIQTLGTKIFIVTVVIGK
jgi:hypothetical protein